MKISTRRPYNYFKGQSIFYKKYLGSKVGSEVTPVDEDGHIPHVSQILSFLELMNDESKGVDECLDKSNLLHMNEKSKDVDERLDIEDDDNESEGGDMEDESSKSTEDDDGIYDSQSDDGDNEDEDDKSSAAKPNSYTVGTKMKDKSKEGVGESLYIESDDNESEGCEDDRCFYYEGGDGDSEDKEDKFSAAKPNENTLGTKMKDKSKECIDERLDIEADDNEREGCDNEDESSAAKANANAKMNNDSPEGIDEQDNSFNQAEPSRKILAASYPSESEKKAVIVDSEETDVKAPLHKALFLIEYLETSSNDDKKRSLLKQLKKDMVEYFMQLTEQVKRLEAEEVEREKQSLEPQNPLMHIFDDFYWDL